VLDDDLVPVAYQFVDARRGDGHAILVVLDLAWDTYLHDTHPLSSRSATPLPPDGPVPCGV
jgi:hypothetical protein